MGPIHITWLRLERLLCQTTQITRSENMGRPVGQMTISRSLYNYIFIHPFHIPRLCHIPRLAVWVDHRAHPVGQITIISLSLYNYVYIHPFHIPGLCHSPRLAMWVDHWTHPVGQMTISRLSFTLLLYLYPPIPYSRTLWFIRTCIVDQLIWAHPVDQMTISCSPYNYIFIHPFHIPGLCHSPRLAVWVDHWAQPVHQMTISRSLYNFIYIHPFHIPGLNGS